MKIDFQRAMTAPPGACEVVLVRHGACDPPAPDGLIGGRSDPPLNERGREEAAAAGERLSRENVASVFISHLRRTEQTAAAILARHPLEPAVAEDIGEIYLGEWEGHGIHSRGERGDPELVRVFAEQRWDLIPGAEPLDGFGERVRRGIEAAADTGADGEIVVVVTHAAVIAEFCRQITSSEPFAFLLNSNGSLTRAMRMAGGDWKLLSFNDTEHIHAFHSRAGAGVEGDGLKG
ncbi:MAG: histidine phosphatase family protein [Solirubrobacterales bacterium]